MIAAYIRVSSKDQNPEMQLYQVEQWLKQNMPDQVHWYVDKETGSTLERVEFKNLRADIEKGRITTVVIWKLDRLSRDMLQGLTVLAEWCEKGLRVVSVTQQIDFSGAVGRLIAAVMLGIAEIEREHIRERQAAGIERAKRTDEHLPPEERRYRGRTNRRRPKGIYKVPPERILELLEKGLKRGEVAAYLGIHRNTVTNRMRAVNGESHSGS